MSWKIRRPSRSAAHFWYAHERWNKGEVARYETLEGIGDQYSEQIRREIWDIRRTMVRSATRPTQVRWSSCLFLLFLLRSLADLIWYRIGLGKPTNAPSIHASKQWTSFPFHTRGGITFPPSTLPSPSHTTISDLERWAWESGGSGRFGDYLISVLGSGKGGDRSLGICRDVRKRERRSRWTRRLTHRSELSCLQNKWC